MTTSQTWRGAYRRALRENRAYYALCDEARRLGVPTSLDDPRSSRTVDGLREAVTAARA